MPKVPKLDWYKLMPATPEIKKKVINSPNENYWKKVIRKK